MDERIHYDLSKRILMIILIFSCAVFGVFLCVVGFAPHDGVNLVQTSNNAVDYTVKLKPNDYFEKDTLPAGGKYVASLIDSFNINFKNDLDFSQQVSGTYSYRIIATISANESKGVGSASYWSRDYELYKSDTNSLDKVKKLNFSRTLTVGYDKYNDMLRSFKEKYSLAANGKLKIALILTGDITSDTITGSAPIKSEMSMSVALTQQAVDVTVDTDAKNNETVLASAPEINENILLACRIIGMILVVAAFVAGYASNYVGRIKEASVEFDENVKKLLSSYDSIIVNLKTAPSLSGIKVSEVNDFDELLDVYNSVHMPINHYSSKNTSTFIIIDDGMAWKYVVRLSDYKN